MKGINRIILGFLILSGISCFAGKLGKGDYVVVEETIKTGTGAIDSYKNYNYGQKGELLGEQHKSYDGRLLSEKKYEYSKGLLQRQYSYLGDKAIASSEYIYDNEGRLIEENQYTGGGQKTAVITYEYDENGNQSKITTANGDGVVRLYEVNEYEAGEIIRTTYHYPDGSTDGFTFYDYNRSGLLMTKASYDGDDKLVRKEEFLYNDDGAIKTILYYRGNSITRTIEIELDENGNRKKEKNIDSKGYVVEVVEKEYRLLGSKGVSKQ